MTTSVSLEAVRLNLRIRPGSKVADRFDGLASEALVELGDLIEVRSCWSMVGNDFPSLPAGLAPYSELALFAITAGERVSERLTQLTVERRWFYASILDAMVNRALDERSHLMDAEFRRVTHAQGLRTTRRYSPGCPHLSLEQLPVLIDALGAEHRIGVRCTSANMLLPLKSLAYLHGADARLTADQPRDFCDTCRRTRCSRSRRGRAGS